MKQIRKVIVLIALVSLVAACSGANPLGPDTILIDTMGLPYAYQANLIPATPYDDSQPPGSMGLPEHVQVNFGVTDPADVQFGDPIIYIVPTEAYKQLWDDAGNTSVSDRLAQLENILAERPDLATARIPVLPFEAFQVMGAGNLGVVAQAEYLDMPWGSGIRFVAVPMQGVDVILNRNVVYIEQGLTADGKYLVSFFYPPIATSALPNSVEEVPQEEFEQVNSGDWATYRQEKEDLLNNLSASDWDPSLATLDDVIGSLQFGDYGQ